MVLPDEHSRDKKRFKKRFKCRPFGTNDEIPKAAARKYSQSEPQSAQYGLPRMEARVLNFGSMTERTERTQLLISNVPVHCDDSHVRKWIEARGFRVSHVKLIRDLVSGTAPSFAHVQLMNATKLEEAARTLNGQTLRGRPIRVVELGRPVTRS